VYYIQIPIGHLLPEGIDSKKNVSANALSLVLLSLVDDEMAGVS